MYLDTDICIALSVKRIKIEIVIKHNIKAEFKPVSYTHLDVYKRQILECMKHFQKTGAF